ncbi:hypothetical protein OSB04_032027 [Centaurea solstitialis]|uniref:MULE transposase domain-containing protein n=1 Tax=Centaurea solstitialis TaxID=347529 RepID=A0AA38SA67_9ASTR|nr:hypothetical protein OSB04_032027 [Centaurea solstitialis]
MEEDLTSTSTFVTNQVFNSREEITAWVRSVGRSIGCVVTTKRSKSKTGGEDAYKAVFECEHSGVYKSDKISSRHTRTRKFDCPFELIALDSVKHNGWTLRVVCDTHNHPPAQHMEGHPYAMRLNEAEVQLVEDLSAQHVKPRYILSTIKGRNVENASTSKTIYNEIQNIKTRNDAGRPKMQVVVDFFVQRNYDFETRLNDETNELEDLFFIHPISLELWRAFPQLLYEIPLLEIVGVTSTNRTFCIAFVFMHKEKISNYTWALGCLKSIIYDNFYPDVIVTDRELVITPKLYIFYSHQFPTFVFNLRILEVGFNTSRAAKGIARAARCRLAPRRKGSRREAWFFSLGSFQKIRVRCWEPLRVSNPRRWRLDVTTTEEIRGNARQIYRSLVDMEDYDKTPDDDVPMWIVRNRQHELTLKKLFEKPVANQSSIQQKDETMDEQSDDQPSWESKEQNWEDRLRNFNSFADFIRKMREESERMR